MKCLLRNDSASYGAWNMAVDEVLLHAAERTGQAALRLYAWREPTLSLGYFQPSRERLEHTASIHCDLVRRLSGGGAILHDRELTYSLALPKHHPLSADARKLYAAVHESIVQILAAHGCLASVLKRAMRADGPLEPFLCFQRRAAGDVVVGTTKIVGSAQRRHRGAILQHGSILLAQSEWAPELPGLTELGHPLSEQELRAELLAHLPGALDLEFFSEPETAEFLSATARLTQRKFSSQEWTHRK